MGKSRRKTAMGPICEIRPGEQKKYKQSVHRRERRAVNVLLNTQQYLDAELLPSFYDEWDSPRDSKTYYGLVGDPEYLKELMRK